MRKYKTQKDKLISKWFNKEITQEELSKLLQDNEERLNKKRKLMPCGIVRTWDELLECEYVYLFGNRPMHIEVIKSMQIRGINRMLKDGMIVKAVRKENK